MAYAIKDWRQVFHLKEAMKHDEISWTKFPVSRSSGKYRRLMATAEGRTAFAVFIGMVRIAARSKSDGVANATAEDVFFETGIPIPDCEAGISMLVSDQIGWLIPDQNTAVSPPVSKRPQNGDQTVTSSLILSSSSLHSEGSVRGDYGNAQIPNSVLWARVLKFYPKQTAIRGAYHEASEAVYRLAEAKYGGDQAKALDFLSDRVRAYAKARNGQPMQYTPKAAKWFEEGMYNDDPAAWQSGEETPEQAKERMRREDAEYAAKEAARKAGANATR